MGMGFLVKIKIRRRNGIEKSSGYKQVAKLKRFWNSCNSKSIWARWLKDHYLKGRNLWEIKTQPMDSMCGKTSLLPGKLLLCTCTYLDRFCANFVWKGKMHTWPWDSLCRSKSGGGMGLRRAQGINNVAKLNIALASA